MCCTRSWGGPGTPPVLVRAAVFRAHTLCFLITPRKHHLGYSCAGDIIVWLYKQMFTWIWEARVAGGMQEEQGGPVWVWTAALGAEGEEGASKGKRLHFFG